MTSFTVATGPVWPAVVAAIALLALAAAVVALVWRRTPSQGRRAATALTVLAALVVSGSGVVSWGQVLRNAPLDQALGATAESPCARITCLRTADGDVVSVSDASGGRRVVTYLHVASRPGDLTTSALDADAQALDQLEIDPADLTPVRDSRGVLTSADHDGSRVWDITCGRITCAWRQA